MRRHSPTTFRWAQQVVAVPPQLQLSCMGVWSFVGQDEGSTLVKRFETLVSFTTQFAEGFGLPRLQRVGERVMIRCEDTLSSAFVVSAGVLHPEPPPAKQSSALRENL
jgi:hypothetical protein